MWNVLTAFVDESQPHGTGSGEPYIVTATIPFDMDTVGDMQDDLRRMRPRNQTKIHWNESVTSFKEELIDYVAGCQVMHWIILRESVAGEAPERARAKALEMLIRELAALELVEWVVAESRGARLDAHDMRVLDQMRSRRESVGGLKLTHSLGVEEAMLWMADVVCGAAGERHLGTSDRLGRLAHQTQEVSTNASFPSLIR
jgi:hypothetical protein